MDASDLNRKLCSGILQAIALADRLENHVVAAILGDALARCDANHRDEPDL